MTGGKQAETVDGTAEQHNAGGKSVGRKLVSATEWANRGDKQEYRRMDQLVLGRRRPRGRLYAC